MKRMLLILFFISFFFAGHTQTVLATDSFYVSRYSDSGAVTPVLDSVRTYGYDSLCRKTSYQAYYADRDSLGSITLRGYQQELYSYYPNDSLRQILYQSKYIFDTAYSNSGRLTYTYNDQGKIATQTYDVQLDSNNLNSWTVTSLVTSTYDAAGNLTDNVTQIYDYNLQQLQYSTESKFEFNSRNQNTVATSLIWSVNLQALVPLERTISDYDGNGFLIKTTEQFHDNNADNPVWETYAETAYYNDSRGLADSSTYKWFQDTNQVTKTYFLYDPITLQPSQVTTYYYYGTQVFFASRSLYIHSVSESMQADTVISENLDAQEDSFVVSNQYALTKFLNEDGTVQKQVESVNWANESYYSFTEDRFGYKSCSSVLPVSLISFTGIQKNNNAVLKWQTANETNTAYFTLQRSTDGVHFNTIGKTTASGAGNYMYTDANITLLLVPRIYYKLVITEKDGSISYSKIAALDITSGKPVVEISPNPVRNLLTIRSAVAIANASISIHDIGGRVVYTARLNIAAGTQPPIDISGLAKGVYVITIQSLTEKYTFKIVKQ